jgi:hypothetical protein
MSSFVSGSVARITGRTLTEFLCFMEPHTPFVRKLLKKIDTQARVSSLQQAMDNILSEAAGIRAKRWWTHEEFNKPA